MAVCMRTSDDVADLIEKVKYLSLGGVHAHGPHGVAQLPGADAAALVPSKIRYSKGIFELPLLLIQIEMIFPYKISSIRGK